MARSRGYAAALGLAAVVVVVLVVAGCGDGGATTTTTTAGSAAGGTTLNGSEIFASVCAGCHGADGTGNTGPDLTALSTLTKERIVDQVTNGGSSMPAYGDRMSAEEIDVVADYVLNDIVK